MQQTKTHQLNKLLYELRPDLDSDKDWDAPEAFIEFRGFAGWFIVYIYCRFFGDDGDYLGANADEAMANLRVLV